MTRIDESPSTSPGLNGATPTSGPSVTTLVTSILDDVKTLAHQQFLMFKSEIREDVKKTKEAAQYGGLSIVLVTVGALSLITAAAYALHEQLALPLWASWGIIGAIFTITGLVFGYLSNERLKSFNPLPDKTFNAIQENLTWTPKE